MRQAAKIEDPSRHLVRFYHQRKERNPSYSRRALARQIGIGAGALSEILAGKRPLTVRVGMRIVDKLKLPEPEAREFLAEITQRELQRSAEIQVEQLRQYSGPAHALEAENPDTDTFRVLADWEHYAILSLVETKDFKSRYQWIAERLGIEPKRCREAIARLQRLGLLRREGARWVLGQSGCSSTTDRASRALRAAYRQSLEQSLAALDTVPVESRDFSSITLAIDPKRLGLAKVLFRYFRAFAARLLETGDRTEVYSLNIQFIPLTQRGKS